MKEQAIDPYYLRFRETMFLVDPRYHFEPKTLEIYTPLPTPERSAEFHHLMLMNPNVIAEVFEADSPQTDYRRYFVVQTQGNPRPLLSNPKPVSLYYNYPLFQRETFLLPKLEEVTLAIVRLLRLNALLS